MTSKEGKIYYGFAKNDKKEGFGVYYTPNPKKIFVGFWKGNKQEGVGKLITEKSTKYGFWSQGERLNWYDSFNQAYSHLRNDQLNFAKLLQIEGKEVNRYISQISII